MYWIIKIEFAFLSNIFCNGVEIKGEYNQNNCSLYCLWHCLAMQTILNNVWNNRFNLVWICFKGNVSFILEKVWNWIKTLIKSDFMNYFFAENITGWAWNKYHFDWLTFYLKYFKLWILFDQILYQRFTTSGWKDIRIRKYLSCGKNSILLLT